MIDILIWKLTIQYLNQVKETFNIPEIVTVFGYIVFIKKKPFG